MGSRGVRWETVRPQRVIFLLPASRVCSGWNKALNPVHCGGAGVPTSFPSDLAWSGPEKLNWGAQPLSLAVPGARQSLPGFSLREGRWVVVPAREVCSESPADPVCEKAALFVSVKGRTQGRRACGVSVRAEAV